MRRKSSSLSFGPGASSLILIFVVLTMTVLGMLSLLSARNDRNLSKRSVQVVEAQYRLMVAAEEKRAEIDRILAECSHNNATAEAYYEAVALALPDDCQMDGSIITFSVKDESRTLLCKLSVNEPDSGYSRTEWQQHSLTAETGDNSSWN